MSVEHVEKTSRSARQKLDRRSKGRTSRRRREVLRGKRLVTASLVAAVALYAAFVVVTAADWRYGYGEDTAGWVSTLTIFTALAVIGAFFAMAAYRGNEVLRHLLAILNLIGALAGLVWLVYIYVQGYTYIWTLLDVAGVAIGFLVAYALLLSKSGVKFLEEQHLRRR